MIVHRPQSDHLFRDSQQINNRYSVIDFSLIQRLLVTAGIGVVLGQRGGEVVRTREILLGTHVEIMVTGVVQYRIYALFGGNTDGTGSKPGIEVGIIG